MTDDFTGEIDTAPQRAWHFKQLKWALQSLAAAGSAQPPLFPEQVQSPDDLAFAFDHWASLLQDAYADEISPAQAAALETLCRSLGTISRDGAEFDADLWTDGALRTSEHWAQVRRQALAAMEAFGWSVDSGEPAP